MASINDGTARAVKALLHFAAAVLLGAVQPALAQSASEPESYRNVDEFGVDLSSGTFNFPMDEITGGSASSGIDVGRVWGQSGWKEAYAGHLKQTSGSNVVIVRGSVSETFTLVSGAWVAAKANGAKLVKGAGNRFPPFTYTAADGTVIQYQSVGANVFDPTDSYPKRFTIEGDGGSCRIPTSQLTQLSPQLCAVPVSITPPDGKKLELSWEEGGECAFYNNGPTDQGYQCVERYRLTGVHDLSGYAASYQYASQFYDYTSGWWRRTGSALTDLSTGNVSSASYSFPSSGTQQVVDQHGLTWTFTFDTAGRMTSITRPGASAATTTIVYGTSGKVSSVTKDGVTRTYSWSTSGGNTVATITGGPTGSGTVTTDPAKGQPGTVTNATSNAVVNGYDGNGRLSSTTWPEGNYVTYTRDARGNVAQTVFTPKSGSGQSAITTSANYDATCSNAVKCNSPNYTVDARGNRTDYTYDPTHGQVTRVQLPAPASGQARPQIDYSYSALYAQEKNGSGVLVNVGTPQYKLTQITSCASAATCSGTANETKVTIAYNTPNLQPTSVTVAAGNGSISSVTAYAYDANDNLVSVDGPLSGTGDTEYTFYDSTNRVVGTISPDPDGSGGNPRLASRVSYDSAGRVWKSESGTAAGTAQTDLNAMTVNQSMETTFDANSRKTIVKRKDSGGTAVSLVQYSYDSAGRPECTAVRMNPSIYGSLPSSACTLGTEGSYGPDRVTRAVYDADGRLAQSRVAVGSAVEGSEGTVSYTANGLLEYLIDGKGNRSRYTYDGFDRRNRWEYPTTAGPSSFDDSTLANAYSTAGSLNATDYVAYGYDANGNLTGLRNRAGETISLAYDALGRLITKTVPERSGLSSTYTRDVYYGYDLLGHPLYARFDSTSGEGLSFVFDALGRMTSTTQAMDGASRTLSYLYDAAGQRTRVTYPDSWYNTYAYDGLSRFTGINDPTYGLYAVTYNQNGAPVTINKAGVGTFSYDAAGRISTYAQDFAVTANDWSGTAKDVTWQYGHNPAGQLTSEIRSNDAYAWPGSVNVDRNYTANGLNQYSAVAGTGFGYDTNGNLTSDDTNTFVYDVENRLISRTGGGTTAALRYDPLGRLYEVNGSATGITRFLYDGDALLVEYSSAGAILRRHVHGPDGASDDPVASIEGATIDYSQYRSLYADRLGSIYALVNSSGQVTTVNSYDEYGIPASGNAGRFQYTGQAWLPELGLYYYKARMYSPTLGRFMQTDPIGYADGMNWYNYVGSDPVNGTDPSGMCHWENWAAFTTWTFADGSQTKTKVEGSDHVVFGSDCDSQNGIVVNGIRGADRGLGGPGRGPQNRLPTPDEIADRQAAACSDPAIQAALGNPSVQAALKDALGQTASTGNEYAFEYGRSVFGGRSVTSVYGGGSDQTAVQSHFSSLMSGIYYREIQFHTHPNPSGRGLSYGPGSDLALARGGWGVVAVRANGEMFCVAPPK